MNNVTETIEIRKIRIEDNLAIESIIKNVLTELKHNSKGTAYYDKDTNAMFEAYQNKKSVYYVVLLNKVIIGGCGIQPLKNGAKNICELQKMYILPIARGKKIGKLLILQSLDFAIKKGFKKCYLETFPDMLNAIKLYQQNGFKKINNPLGDTYHYACNTWMLKNLTTY